MATTEERMRVLRMVEEGKISAEQGARLLAAMVGEQSGAARSGRRGAAPPRAHEHATSASGPRVVRLRVTDASSGKARVNLTLPMGVVEFLMRTGRRFAPLDLVDLPGLDLDELSEALAGGATGRVLDFYDQDEGHRVEVVVE
jgi:hypothetical protein